MTKGRSPNYPQLTLEEAIQRIRPLYEAAHTYSTEKRVIAENLGYNGLHGKSLTLIGALRRYALLEPEGEGMRVSDDAVTILELPKGDPQRMAALGRAAFAPRLFAEMYAEFGNVLPNDVTLKHHLIKKQFLPKAAEEVVRVYRANLELVKEETGAYNDDMIQPAEVKTLSLQPERTPPTPNTEGFARSSATVPQTGFKVEISDKAVFVSYSGTVDRGVIERLIKYLEITRDAFTASHASDDEPDVESKAK
ncbi:MAG: hypothetical protein H0W99_12745 [Acidobacteria bacterium]|nr:hypothetical protein [Acidobacteriota bacterium]